MENKIEKKAIEEIVLTIHNIQAVQNFIGTFKFPGASIQGNNGMGKSTILKILGSIFGADIKFDVTTGKDSGDISAIIKTKDNKQWVYGLTKTANGKEKAFLIEPDGEGIQESKVKSTLQSIFGYQFKSLNDFEKDQATAEGRKNIAKMFLSFMPQDIVARIAENNNYVNERTGTLYTKRTQLRKDIDTQTAIIQNIRIPEDLPNVDDIHIAASAARTNITTINAEIDGYRTQIQELEQKILEANRRKESHAATLRDCETKLVIIGSRADDIQRKEQAVTKLSEMKSQDMQITTDIEARRAENKRLISENLPIPDMTFDDDEIRVGGLTLDKMAKSDRMIMFAKILKHINAVGVILMDDWESITDPARRQAAMNFAVENECLLIVCEAKNAPLTVQQFTINEA